MKKILALIGFVSVLCYSCEKVEVPKGTPKCVKMEIQNILLEDPWNPPAVITSYMYNGELVYFFPSHCCDIPSILYDEDCNVICMPDGGITGVGDGMCQDFFGSRTNEEFIWRDDRL